MLTSRTARWTAGTALLCLALLAVSWLFLVSPRRAEAQQLRDENAAAQNQNDLLEVKIAQLKAQFVKLPESQAALADILAQMPADAGMPRLVRDLDTMASRSGVDLTSIAPGAAQTLATTTTPGAAATAAAAPAAGGTGTAATTGSGIVQIPVTLVVSGDYFQSVAFLKQLQTQMPRAFLVTAVQMTGSSADSAAASGTQTGTVQVTITGSVFSLPQTGTDTAAATSGSSAGSAGTATGPVGAAATPAVGATAAATTPTASAN